MAFTGFYDDDVVICCVMSVSIIIGILKTSDYALNESRERTEQYYIKKLNIDIILDVVIQ